MQYTSPQAFVTGGVLRGASSQQEIISLPRTFTPRDGSGLEVELSPSLAGSLLSALEAMEVPAYAISAEASLSYLLPNIEVHRALNNAGLERPRTVGARHHEHQRQRQPFDESLQNEDGGWNWWGTSFREERMSLTRIFRRMCFFGLLRAHEISARQ
ncbi:MAG: hypothetical protein M0C28_44270 [Candidatus Moduliflexus flocculans]|nr:hypothetical protein [Candidatus Moduliflexus flocculans]